MDAFIFNDKETNENRPFSNSSSITSYNNSDQQKSKEDNVATNSRGCIPSTGSSVATDSHSASFDTKFNRFKLPTNRTDNNRPKDIANTYSSKGPIREIIVDEIYHPFYVFSIEPVPESIKEAAKESARILEEYKYTLRTDTVSEMSKLFELSITRKEEFLPWNDFNEKKSKFAFNTQSSKILAKMFNPKFDDMKKAVQAFQCRNARSILGQNVKSPIQLAIVWSPDGAEHIKQKTRDSTFISHQLALASALRIPIFNLENDNSVNSLKEYLSL